MSNKITAIAEAVGILEETATEPRGIRAAVITMTVIALAVLVLVISTAGSWGWI